MDFLTFPKLWLGLVGLTQTPWGAAGVLHDLLLTIGSPEAWMLFPWTWKAKRALHVPCSSPAGTRGPQAYVLCPHTHRQTTVPGIQAILPAERVLYGQSPVVELQSGKTAFIQAQHLPMAKGS